MNSVDRAWLRVKNGQSEDMDLAYVKRSWMNMLPDHREEFRLYVNDMVEQYDKRIKKMNASRRELWKLLDDIAATL